MRRDELFSNLDPELARQLDSAPFVQAIVRLRASQPGRLALPPDETETVAKRVLERVQRELGRPPRAVNIFRNLGYFVVDAESQFVRRLIEQDEIVSASANYRRGNMKAGSGYALRNPRS
ncbi:hypothetical protein NVS55_00945 [Myxococcus stipitatus]|uniref:hypothetical protein n=1 Tax=Myxococcus stipitatus TaxID=83455 RepID=UPI00314569C3